MVAHTVLPIGRKFALTMSQPEVRQLAWIRIGVMVQVSTRCSARETII